MRKEKGERKREIMEELWQWCNEYFRVKKEELSKTYVINLEGWKIALNRHKRNLGICDYNTKTIYLSKYLLEKEKYFSEKIKLVILHELAHAIVGPDHGHDKVWKEIVVKIGGSPNRCSEFNVESKWSVICPNDCFSPLSYHRKPQMPKVCKKCQCQVNLVQNY